MPNSIRATLQSLFQRTPHDGLAGAALWLVVSFFLSWLLTFVRGAIGTFFGVLQILIVIALACVAIPLLVRFIRNRMLWSLRNKLILTYLLIGLAPVVLGITLVTISAYIAAGQFSIHLADTRVQAELDQMSADNSALVARIVPIFGLKSDSESRSRSQDLSDSERAAASTIKGPRLHRHLEAFVNGTPFTLPTSSAHPTVPLGLPAWAVDLKNGSFRSLVLDGGDTYLVAVNQQRLADGRLFTLLSSLPVDSGVMDFISDGLGRAAISSEKTAEEVLASNRKKERPFSSRSHLVSGGTQPPSLNVIDIPVHFFSTLAVTDWETGKSDGVPINVDSRPSLLYLQLFGASLGGIVTSTIRVGLIVLCIIFTLIELLALVMAMRMSRTMTASVHDLYEATLSIDRGDLHHRIAVSRTDQLAELSRSFNRMTVSLQRLLEEQQEKERLQNELSIAQEVQANLFPTAVRDLPTLELHGVCRPARSVSGDYYDFLVFYKDDLEASEKRVETGVGIALGDISGKGISAALLMATLHSAVRAYRFASEAVVYSASSVAGLTASRDGRSGDSGELFESPGRIMSLLNRHLYRSTQPEKYATLFLAHYDAASAWLTYSNAGQLPPFLLGRDNSIRRLDCGGTVVGLMDGMQYEEGRFRMSVGDILIAYSDGVTEPENDFGDFGEERLIEVVTRYRDEPLHIISAQVMQALDAWIGADEQPDDITLVLARQL
ncbi:PP2C family protein-serine/threonine phosphatase [Granulicella arctica]|uniref:PP2C family protein-serine/threonine phosphatase n=1 Tax=Granulicella arctica TaxID=940613 RepID=UPI0021E0375F|nr:PP2C family protein-serine/threonine phosphatase [Granulicella arctica]